MPILFALCIAMCLQAKGIYNLPPGVEHAINNPLLKETASIIAITPVGDPVAIALERDLTFRVNC